MKLKELESYLTQCEVFKKPKVQLEQYHTSAHVAARMLYSAQEYLEGATVCDLGSGCGVLSIGSIMMGASLVYGFEVDEDALDIALSNVQDILVDEDDSSEHPPIQFIQTEITPDFHNLQRFSSFFDVVVMNPPFGTKQNSGADFLFLRQALNLLRPGGHIYSLHKTTTRPFFLKKLKEDEEFFKVKGEVLAAIRYDLPKCYRFHKEKSVDIEVDFWHFQKFDKDKEEQST